ncbi:MAG: DUF502 domain-containing protein [Breznakibacter sp.]
MKKLVRYFLQGLLYITPLAVTLYVIIVSFFWIDGLLRDLPFLQQGDFSQYSFPGIGILVIVTSVTLIGYVGQRIISAPLVSFVEGLLDRTPLIKVIYTSVKDLLSAFVGKEKKFDQPVLVKLDNNNVVERLGFITSADLSNLGIADKIAVYMPSSYGMLGELVIVPKDHVTPINAHSSDVMKFIVSGGVTRIN